MLYGFSGQKNHLTRPFPAFFVLILFVMIGILAGCVGINRDRFPSNESAHRERIKHESTILQSYRLPSASDVKQDWAYRYESSEGIPWNAVADLNGDGTSDYAYLLPQKSESGFGLWVLLSEGSDHRSILLKTWDEPIYRAGLYRQPPGTYTILVTDQEHGSTDRKELELEQELLGFVFFEASSRLYYWDKTRGGFQTAWTSD